MVGKLVKFRNLASWKTFCGKVGLVIQDCGDTVVVKWVKPVDAKFGLVKKSQYPKYFFEILS